MSLIGLVPIKSAQTYVYIIMPSVNKDMEEF